MLTGGAVRSAALIFFVLQQEAQAAPLAPCGCRQFELATAPFKSEAVLSPQARSLRDFVLFSHRRIGADLIRKQGPYLGTLSSAFSFCSDESVKLAWLRKTFSASADTREFAERMAQQFDSSHACPANP